MNSTALPLRFRGFRFTLAWVKGRRKLYVHTPAGNCLHFGRLIGRWSYGFDRSEPDPVGELEV